MWYLSLSRSQYSCGQRTIYRQILTNFFSKLIWYECKKKERLYTKLTNLKIIDNRWSMPVIQRIKESKLNTFINWTMYVTLHWKLLKKWIWLFFPLLLCELIIYCWQSLIMNDVWIICVQCSKGNETHLFTQIFIQVKSTKISNWLYIMRKI